MVRTRKQKLESEAAGAAPSPPRALPATKRRKTRAPAKSTKASEPPKGKAKAKEATKEVSKANETPKKSHVTDDNSEHQSSNSAIITTASIQLSSSTPVENKPVTASLPSVEGKGAKTPSLSGNIKIAAAAPRSSKKRVLLGVWHPPAGWTDLDGFVVANSPSDYFNIPYDSFITFLSTFRPPRLRVLITDTPDSKRKREPAAEEDVPSSKRAKPQSSKESPKKPASRSTPVTNGDNSRYDVNGAFVFPQFPLGSDSEEDMDEVAVKRRQKEATKIKAAENLRAFQARKKAQAAKAQAARLHAAKLQAARIEAANAKAAEEQRKNSSLSGAHANSSGSGGSGGHQTSGADHSSQDFAQQTSSVAPLTPQRQGIFGSLSKSVGRFVPAIPFFGRSPAPVTQSSLENSPSVNNAAPTSPSPAPAKNQTRSRKVQGNVDDAAKGPDSNAKENQASRQSEAGNSDPPIFRRRFRDDPDGFFDRTKLPRSHDIGEMILSREPNNLSDAAKEELLSKFKDVIDKEVTRLVEDRVKEMATPRSKSTALIVAPATDGKLLERKRKRHNPIPEVIPNPPNVSYGMNMDFFFTESDAEDSDEFEDDMSDDELPKLSFPSASTSSQPAAKKSRLSYDIVPQRDHGDPHRARPYTGREFADPKDNIFNAQRNRSTPKHNASKANVSGRFAVPDDSDDSDSDMENGLNEPSRQTKLAASQPTTNGVLSSDSEADKNLTPKAKQNGDAKSPALPPAPVPQHANLPSSQGANQLDILAQKRAQANKYAPKQPSRLRDQARLSSSTIGSVADQSPLPAEPKLDAVPEAISKENGIPTSAKAKAQEIIARYANRFDDSSIDPLVRSAFEANDAEYPTPPLDIAEISHAGNPFVTDPEVTNAFKADWNAKDDQNAAALFSSELASFRSLAAPTAAV